MQVFSTKKYKKKKKQQSENTNWKDSASLFLFEKFSFLNVDICNWGLPRPIRGISVTSSTFTLLFNLREVRKKTCAKPNHVIYS